MKKRLASFIFAAAMVLSLPAASFAADQTIATDPVGTSTVSDGGDNVKAFANSYVNTNRISNTSGTVNAYAAFTDTASRAACVIYLQEKYNGSWRAATGLGTTSYTKTAYNCNSISAGKTFTLISGKVYRAKVVFTHVIDGTTYTKTRYSGSF